MGWLILLVLLPRAAFGSEVPAKAAQEAGPQGKPGQEVRVTYDAERHVVIEDLTNRFRLSLPGPYWEYRTAEQMTAQTQGQGCTPGGRAIPGLLLMMNNKDAPAGASLQVVPQRFLMRGRQDLEDYIAREQESIRSRGRGALKFEKPAYGEEGGVINCRLAFTDPRGAQPAKYMLVSYFVRPEGEDALVYSLMSAAPEKESERQSEDFEFIVRGFRFEGKLAGEFFVPEAPAEKLPGAKPPAQPVQACGQNYWGVLAAVLIVMAVYMFMRKRLSRPGI
jgi:hypothetical protein